MKQSPYLRLIQKTGATRHPGGLLATDTLLDRAHIEKETHILDVGCGAGHTMVHITKKYGCRITGIDISAEAIDRAFALYHKEPYFSKLDFVVGDVLSLPFGDGLFDVVLCESVLIFVEDKKKALHEMARVLKPQGFLAINELCRSDKANDVSDFFARPEIGGFLPKPAQLKKPLEKDFSPVFYDEKPLKLSEQFLADIKQWASFQGMLHIFEGVHQALTDAESRADLLKIVRLFLALPKDAFSHLNWLLMLEQKRQA